VVYSGNTPEGVSFSPDRATIAWTSYPEGTLWRSRLDGTERVQLTQGPSIARFPHWSPDGSAIVFTAAHPGSDWQLYTVPARGGAINPLLQGSTGQGVATWSVDGKALAFGDLINMGETQALPSAIELYRLGGQKATTVPGSIGL
jgi:Tol biopolymer transport system component